MAGSIWVLPVTAALAAVGYGEGQRRRGEFRNGEFHGAEEIAGIVGAAGYALLVGNDEISGGNEILGGTNKTDKGENTQRDHQDATLVVLASVTALATTVVPVVMPAERAGETARNGVRHVAGAAAAANRLVAERLQHPHTQHDGLHHLDHGGGDTPLLVAGLRLGAEGGAVRTGTEHTHRGIAAEEHDLLFQNSDPVEFGGLGAAAVTAADASLENELDVEADVNGVEATIELDGIQTDIGPGDAGILDPNLGGAVNDLPTQIGEKNADVLKAIAIAAGIQDTVGFHAHGAGVAALATTAHVSAAGDETIFRHTVYLHMD